MWLFSVLKTEQWDRYKYLRGLLILAMVICSVGSVGNWYNWVNGTVHLDFPVLLTLGALLVFVMVPRKWDLITLSLGYLFLLSIIATALRRADLRLGLGMIGTTGTLYFTCVYIKMKRDDSKHKNEGHNVSFKKD